MQSGYFGFNVCLLDGTADFSSLIKRLVKVDRIILRPVRSIRVGGVGKPVLKEELQELYSSNFDSFSNDYGLYDTYWMLRNKPLVDQWRMENPDYITQMSDWANAHADLDGGIYNNLEPTGDNDAGIAATSISQKWEEVLPQLITAESDEKFDQIMADYVQWRENNGYAQVVEYEQNLLDTRKEMLS